MWNKKGMECSHNVKSNWARWDATILVPLASIWFILDLHHDTPTTSKWLGGLAHENSRRPVHQIRGFYIFTIIMVGHRSILTLMTRLTFLPSLNDNSFIWATFEHLAGQPNWHGGANSARAGEMTTLPLASFPSKNAALPLASLSHWL
jgi:hypothetical protein